MATDPPTTSTSAELIGLDEARQRELIQQLREAEMVATGHVRGRDDRVLERAYVTEHRRLERALRLRNGLASMPAAQPSVGVRAPRTCWFCAQPVDAPARTAKHVECRACGAELVVMSYLGRPSWPRPTTRGPSRWRCSPGSSR